MHTTIATTMLDGGSIGANVLPEKVTANINLRTSELDSIESVINRFKKITKNVDITCSGGLEPSLCSDVETYGFKMISKCINDFVEGVKVVPTMICGGTDARYYDDLTKASFRVSPFIYDESLRSTVHYVNERMDKKGFVNGIRMLIHLIQETC